MNITDANRLIGACNALTRGFAEMAQAIEQIAWESIEDDYALSGPRPLAPARVEEPSMQAALDEAQTASDASEPTPVAEPAPVVSLEQVRGMLTELSQQGLTAQVRQLILDLGADILSKVPADKYAELLARAEELSHA